jgi:hypothetical protein
MKKIGLPLRFGIAISGCLIAFFLILSLFNLHTSPGFSLFNGVIIGFGIYEAIKSYKLRQGSKFNYTGGFKTGILTGFVPTIIFTIFFAFYAVEFESDFLFQLLESFRELEFFNTETPSSHIKLGTTAMVGPEFDKGIEIILRLVALSVVGFMGLISTLILTLLLMQIFVRNEDKSEWNNGIEKNKNTDL